jgi:hypothetical protein
MARLAPRFAPALLQVDGAADQQAAADPFGLIDCSLHQKLYHLEALGRLLASYDEAALVGWLQRVGHERLVSCLLAVFAETALV